MSTLSNAREEGVIQENRVTLEFIRESGDKAGKKHLWPVWERIDNAKNATKKEMQYLEAISQARDCFVRNLQGALPAEISLREFEQYIELEKSQLLRHFADLRLYISNSSLLTNLSRAYDEGYNEFETSVKEHIKEDATEESEGDRTLPLPDEPGLWKDEVLREVLFGLSEIALHIRFPKKYPLAGHDGPLIIIDDRKKMQFVTRGKLIDAQKVFDGIWQIAKETIEGEGNEPFCRSADTLAKCESELLAAMGEMNAKSFELAGFIRPHEVSMIKGIAVTFAKKAFDRLRSTLENRLQKNGHGEQVSEAGSKEGHEEQMLTEKESGTEAGPVDHVTAANLASVSSLLQEKLGELLNVQTQIINERVLMQDERKELIAERAALDAEKIRLEQLSVEIERERDQLRADAERILADRQLLLEERKILFQQEEMLRGGSDSLAENKMVLDEQLQALVRQEGAISEREKELEKWQGARAEVENEKRELLQLRKELEEQRELLQAEKEELAEERESLEEEQYRLTRENGNGHAVDDEPAAHEEAEEETSKEETPSVHPKRIEKNLNSTGRDLDTEYKRLKSSIMNTVNTLDQLGLREFAIDFYIAGKKFLSGKKVASIQTDMLPQLLDKISPVHTSDECVEKIKNYVARVRFLNDQLTVLEETIHNAIAENGEAAEGTPTFTARQFCKNICADTPVNIGDEFMSDNIFLNELQAMCSDIYEDKDSN